MAARRSDPGEANASEGAFSPEEVIEALYRGLLDRYPDPEGLAHNVGLLRTGIDLPSMVHGFRHSAEASAGFLRSTELARLGMVLWSGAELRRQEPLIYFCHIMKTAGTALVDAIVAAAGPRFCLTQIFLDHLVAMPSLVLNQAGFVSGHLGLEALDYLPPGTVTVTVLRDPLERTLSHYAHVRADPALVRETRSLSLEEFIGSPRWRALASNFQARNLVHRIDLPGAWTQYSPAERLASLRYLPDRSDLPLQSLFHYGPLEMEHAALREAALDRLASIEHVGVTEALDDLWPSVARRWGITEPAAVPRANVASDRPRADSVPPSLRQEILEVNDVDMALYEAAAARLPRRVGGNGPARAAVPAGPDPARPAPPARPALLVRTIALLTALRRLGSEPWAAFGLALCLGLAAVDSLDGRLILIPSLAAGPCAALATRSWRKTLAVGAVAVVLAVLLGVPDDIWATGTHMALVAVVLATTLLATGLCLLVSRGRPSIDRLGRGWSSI